MGKGGAHFGNLEEIKNALGEAAYEQVKAILDEEERRKRDHPGGGGVLDRTAIRDGVVERLAEFEASIEDAVEAANKAHGLVGPLTLWVRVESHRERDVDNCSAKAAVDALVTAGVLEGDSRKTIIREVKEVVVVSADKPERTIIKLFKVKIRGKETEDVGKTEEVVEGAAGAD